MKKSKRTGRSTPITVHTYAKCSTCRNATAWLRAHDIPFLEKPIVETPPSTDELQQMLLHQEGNLRRLFNTSGMEYRARGLTTRLTKMTVPEALRLLTSNGMLVKRPFVLGEDFGLVGFNETQWSAALT